MMQYDNQQNYQNKGKVCFILTSMSWLKKLAKIDIDYKKY